MTSKHELHHTKCSVSITCTSPRVLLFQTRGVRVFTGTRQQVQSMHLHTAFSGGKYGGDRHLPKHQGFPEPHLMYGFLAVGSYPELMEGPCSDVFQSPRRRHSYIRLLTTGNDVVCGHVDIRSIFGPIHHLPPPTTYHPLFSCQPFVIPSKRNHGQVLPVHIAV